MGGNKWSRFGLLAALLVITVAVTGCFGGGGAPRATGGVRGIVYVPNKGDASPPIEILGKGLTIPSESRPLAYATVKIAGKTTKTDFEGRFELGGIPVGRRQIEIAHGNYKPYTGSVVVTADDYTWLSPVQLGVGYYLLVGVGNFSFGLSGTIENLEDGPKNDVLAMELALAKDDLWLGGYTMLIDSDATYNNFKSELANLTNQMHENDFLVIYFSGHGDGGYDSLLGADVLILHDEFVIDVELEGWLRDAGLAREQVTLILDACYSGSFADGNTRFPEGFMSKAFMKRGYTILASSDNSNPSFQGNMTASNNRYGLFTYHLVNGFLSGEADINGDGKFTAYELKTHVDRHVGGVQSVYLYPSEGNTTVFQYR